jgi:uncharacterized protein YcfJ
MNRKLAVASTLLAGSLAFANAASASDSILGAIVGGGAGVLVGQAVGGRDGAIVGGALGAITGAVIADDDDGNHRGHRRAYVQPRQAYVVPPRPVYYEAPPVVVEPRPVRYVAGDWNAEGRFEHRHHARRDGPWDRGWDNDRYDRWERRD